MIFETVVGFFQNLVNSIPEEYKLISSLFLYTTFIIIYSIFIWKFYRFMAERDIIKLNLKQYTASNHPELGKFFEVLLSIFEYAVILPFLVLFWFTVFAIFFLLLSESQSAEQILLITAAIIASTRVAAYVSMSLSRDIAKIFPFTVMVLFLLDPNFFKINTFFDKLIQIPSLFDKILVFVIFIFAVELILRIIYSLAALIYSVDD
jgi:hypothetical protein